MNVKAASARSKVSKTPVVSSGKASNDEIVLDDRRRLENRLEELKLEKETREFDFDLEMEF